MANKCRAPRTLSVPEFRIFETISEAGREFPAQPYEWAMLCLAIDGGYRMDWRRSRMHFGPATLAFQPPGEVYGSQTCSDARQAPTTRRPLNRRRVLQAALDHIDRHGLTELTMRRLAAELGVEAASLYKHVTNKEDLQAGVAELVWEQIADAAPPSRDWPAWLSAYGHAVRDAIHRHPGTLALWATQPIAPVPALELWDAQLQHCRPGTRDQGAEVLRVIGAFAIGYASTEFSWYATPSTQPPESDTQRISRIARALPPNAPDRLIDIALLVCTGDTTHTFETGLNLMIKGLALPVT